MVFGISTQCHSRFISLSATRPRPPRDKRLAILCVSPACARAPKAECPRNQDQHRLRPLKRALSDELELASPEALEEQKNHDAGKSCNAPSATQPWEDGASRATSSAGAPASEKMPRQLEVPAHVSLRQSTVGTAGGGLGTNKHQVQARRRQWKHTIRSTAIRQSPNPRCIPGQLAACSLVASASTLEASRKPPRTHRHPSFSIDPMSLYASHACVSLHDHVPPLIYADTTLEPLPFRAQQTPAMLWPQVSGIIPGYSISSERRDDCAMRRPLFGYGRSDPCYQISVIQSIPR